MRTKNRTLFALLVVVALLGSKGIAGADVASDRSAAILIFPRILAPIFDTSGPASFSLLETDTLIQITNTTNEPVRLHCFYVSANSHCTISDTACSPPEVGCPFAQDLCVPGWIETDFDVHLTPQQPLAWSAAAGLARDLLPLDGVNFVGPRGDSNAGTAIPPVARESVVPPQVPITFDLFTGELKCIVVDAAGRGIANNAIKGEASVVSQITSLNSGGQTQVPLVEKYNGIGIQAIEGDINDDGVLELGGEANEYNGCPNVLIVNHFFDTIDTIDADLALSSATVADALQPTAAPLVTLLPRFSELTLVPCSEDLRLQVPGSTVAQFLVYNEFEQRVSTSRTVDCYFRRVLSTIDTSQPELSIFFAGVAGTVAGQTRVRGVTGGLLGVLSEQILTGPALGPPFGLDNAVNVHLQGDRATADRIVLP